MLCLIISDMREITILIWKIIEILVRSLSRFLYSIESEYFAYLKISHLLSLKGRNRLLKDCISI